MNPIIYHPIILGEIYLLGGIVGFAFFKRKQITKLIEAAKQEKEKDKHILFSAEEGNKCIVEDT